MNLLKINKLLGKKDTQKVEKTSEQKDLELKIRRKLEDILTPLGCKNRSSLTLRGLFKEFSKTRNRHNYKFKRGYSQEIDDFDKLDTTNDFEGLFMYLLYYAETSPEIQARFDDEEIEELFRNNYKNYLNIEEKKENFNEDNIIKNILKDIRKYEDSDGFYSLSEIKYRIHEEYHKFFFNTNKTPNFDYIENKLRLYLGFRTKMELVDSMYVNSVTGEDFIKMSEEQLKDIEKGEF